MRTQLASLSVLLLWYFTAVCWPPTDRSPGPSVYICPSVRLFVCCSFCSGRSLDTHTKFCYNCTHITFSLRPARLQNCIQSSYLENVHCYKLFTAILQFNPWTFWRAAYFAARANGLWLRSLDSLPHTLVNAQIFEGWFEKLDSTPWTELSRSYVRARFACW
jgi:hypothetical protein